MDDDERKRKLEAGKAKLASFQKKRRSSGKSPRSKKHSTHEKDSISGATPGADDSIAVQTGSDNTDKRLDISEESDVSTTADEMSTEEEASYAGGISPRERIQELELTVSDQQIALQKLTLENKELRVKEAELEETLTARDVVIGELRENVTQTASHVKKLQENLSSATESIRETDGNQSEIVNQLMQARKDLKLYVEAIKRQEEAMKEMASKLGEKSIEAEEAHEVCRSLKVELQKSMQTRTLSSDDADSAMQRLRSDLEEQHGQQIAIMKKELDKARHEVAEFKDREERRLLESQESSASEMDQSDLIALQEQVSQLSLQLEASFSNADKERKEHDKEVVKLNQRLIRTIDEYEEKLQTEKEVVADLEGRLDMSDTVSSEIQASFSKQLQQMEEERDNLKSQLRDAHSATIENAASAKIIEDLEDQLTTYRAEVEETEKRLEERNKQNRKLQDELDRRKDEITKKEKENKKLHHDATDLRNELEELRQKMDDKKKEYDESCEKHNAEVEVLKKEHGQRMENALQETRRVQEETDAAREQLEVEMEVKLKKARTEHSDELKNLHSQHHRQMEDLKKQMEDKLQGVKEALEQEKKEQLGAVKDVHERSRERELTQLMQSHKEETVRIRQEHESAIQVLVGEHEEALNNMKERHDEEKVLEENRIRREMKEDFQSEIQDIKTESESEKNKELEQLQNTLQEKHSEEMIRLEAEFSAKTQESREHGLKIEKEAWERKLQECEEGYKSELDDIRTIHDEEKKEIKEQHNTKLEELQGEHKKRLEEREEEMKKLLQEQREEQEAAIQLIKDEATVREETDKQIAEQMEALQKQFSEATVKLEEEYAEKISVLEAEHITAINKIGEDNEKLKQSLSSITAERDEILSQAEESRKKLENIHHEEMLALRQELENHVQEHKDKVQRLHVEMESTRASRSQLQELKDELVARNAAVEQVELLRSEFTENEQRIVAEHKQLVEKLNTEHETEISELRKQLEERSLDSVESVSALEKELEEYKIKLSAAQANLASLSSSSPMRPISSASDYDPANLSALNKDYRGALTITHISDVSGIEGDLEEGALHMTAEDEMIEEQMEEGELPTLEEGELVEGKDSHLEMRSKEEHRDSLSSSTSSSSSSSSSSGGGGKKGEEAKDKVTKESLEQESLEKNLWTKESLEEQIENEDILKEKIVELEKKLQLVAATRQEEVRNLTEKHETQLLEARSASDAEKREALKMLEEQYVAEKEEIQRKHDEAIQTMEEEKQNEIVQLRLKCASETASQVEEELDALRKELEATHRDEIESLKLALENETSEKIAKYEEKLQEKSSDLSKISEEHARSMEEKISAIMAELYEQKQESLRKLAEEHRIAVQKITDEDVKSMEEKENQWEEKKEEFEQNIEKLTLDVVEAKAEYQNLAKSLEAGDNDIVKSIRLNHEQEILRLREEHTASTEAKLKEQARDYEQAQSDYVKQHQERLDKFLNEREEDIRRVEESKRRELVELDESYKREIEQLKLRSEDGKVAEQSEIERKFEDEKRKLLEEHNDELKAVATKLVEIKEERDELAFAKEQLQNQLQQLESEQEQSQAELKTALIAHHMEKFQAAITELDQHHLEEMEKVKQDRDDETEQHKKVAGDLVQKMKDLEEEYKSSVQSVKDEKDSALRAMEEEFNEKLEEEKIDRGSALTSMREAHDAQVQALQEEHDTQLKMIEEEVANQEKNNREALDSILQSQASKLDELQQQFDVALNATRSEGEEKAKDLCQRVEELESQLRETMDLQSDLESARCAIENIEGQSEAWKVKEEEMTKNHQEELEEVASSLEAAKEELQEMSSKIEFERAEYESEIDQLQEDIRTKDENVKELESELAKNTTALNSLKEKFDTVTTRKEREGREEDNLIHMLRDDLDRLNNERDQLSNANQQLLATLTELVQANHKCEDIIVKKLRMSSIGRVSRDSCLSRTDLNHEKSDTEAEKRGEAAVQDSEQSSLASAKLFASTGSFEDEGLDLSQRLAESMFAGPELDASVREVAVGSGTRLQQAVERLLNALQENVQQLNVAQQPQICLDDDADDEKDRSRKSTQDEDSASSKSSESDDTKKMEGVLTEYMNHQLDLEKKVQEREEDAENLRTQIAALRGENIRLQEESKLLQKQKEALTEGGDETELDLIKLTEELATEKRTISDQYEASRMHLDKKVHHLEATLETESKKMEDKERDHAAEVEDLQTQINAMQKQISSNAKFSSEQSAERELEREQFQQEINLLEVELGKRQDLHRSDSKLMQERAAMSKIIEQYEKLAKASDSSAGVEGHCFSPVTSSTPVGIYRLGRTGASGQVGLGACSIINAVSRLEEEMESRDLAHQEQIAKMEGEEEKMKKTLLEYKENLQELREKDSDVSELDMLKGQVQDMTGEREVIQQELYDTLLKVSALEAKLDQYKHSANAPANGAGDASRLEQLKMNLDQEREENESKMELMMEVQGRLKNEIIEKEDEIEHLLQEIENLKELEAENIKLKEDLKQKEEGLVPPSSSRAEELEALSKQLLEEKNTEIDELQLRLQELEQKCSSSSSESSEDEEKASAEKLKGENSRLLLCLQEAEEKLAAKEQLQQLESEVSDQGEDLQVENIPARDEVISSLQEELEALRKDNDNLKTEIRGLEETLEASVEASRPLSGLSLQMKEKIRLLEECLEKEKQEEDDEDSTYQDDDPSSGAQKMDFEEKFQDLENELKSQPKSVLGRILTVKDDKISMQDQKMKETEDMLADHKVRVYELQEKVSDLERGIAEPDAAVCRRSKGDMYKGEEKVGDVEKDSLSSSEESESEELSSSSSSDRETEDVVDGPNAQDLESLSEAKPLQSMEKSAEELKVLLDQREKEIKDKDNRIENDEKMLSEKQEESERLLEKIRELEVKCEELGKELDERLEEAKQSQGDMRGVMDLTEEELLNVPAVQSALARATNNLQQALKVTQNEITSSKEEKEKLLSDLGDVQREYMALLGESERLGDMQEAQAVLEDGIKDLESLVAERENELQQAQQESDQLRSNVHQLQQDIGALKQGQDQEEDEKAEKVSELKDTLARKVDEFNLLLEELQGKEETIEELERQNENSVQKSKAHEDEIELLQNEQKILNLENDRLQGEMESMKSKVESLEHAVREKEKEIESKRKELEVINQERFIEPESVMPLEEGSLEDENISSKSSSSKESVEELPFGDQSAEELVKIHAAKMEEMKNKYAQALTGVVEDTRRKLLEEHDRKIQEMQEKHRKEVAEILSESFTGDSEVARKLREELDLADQLDSNLMGHLASAGGVEETNDPGDTVDIPTKLQGLLDRIHNEGIQVLSLSELQFLKQHQRPLRSACTATTPPATAEEAQQTSMQLEEDTMQLRKAWESEKLALLNAIQALKELVTQTNIPTSSGGVQQLENDDPRGNLLGAVSDVFERERDALIAELQTTVLEAQRSARNDPEKDAALEKLEALEIKLKNQGAQHTAALERLMNIDRDSLLSEIKDLRNCGKQNLKQAEDRIQHLESQLKSRETAATQNISLLQSQVERLEYKLQQERALAADVRSSLEAERVRSEDHMPALQRERDRSVELDDEIGRLQRKLADEAEATRARTESLQAEVDESRCHLDELRSKLSDARQKLTEAEQEAEQVRRGNESARAGKEQTVKDLKRALASEESRRISLVKSLDAERNNVAQLHEELATLRADSHQEIETQKISLAEQDDKLAKEKQISEDLNIAFQRERETSERLRNTLEEERALTKEARQHDRATVADLQKILDDAKHETESLQKKIDKAEREARITKQQLEDARMVHQDAIEAEQAVQDQLKSALDKVQEQKHEVQNKLLQLEEEARRKNISNTMTNAGVLASASTPEGLLAHRRQLESMRQRLQLEATKLQDLMSKSAQRLPVTAPTDSFNQPLDDARALASEMEQLDSVKRSLAEMQQELREMYSELSTPQTERIGVLEDTSGFNDRLMEQNAELVQLNTRHTDEKMALRDALRRLEEEVWKARAGSEESVKSTEDAVNKQHQKQVQDMASRMHRLYVRYLRAESFRKSLVYQKKYLLLLIGGFQDCEEATLALVARMGAYPNADADELQMHRSAAFKRFRSAARVVIAVHRLKFLVKKWTRTSHSISTSIQEKHGTMPLVNGHRQPQSSHRHAGRPVSPYARPVSSTSAHGYYEKSPSPAPLPQYSRDGYEQPISSYAPYRQTLRAASQHMDTSPTKLSSRAAGARPKNAYARSTTSPYLHSYGDQPSATALRYLGGNERPSSSSRQRPRSYHADYRSPDLSSVAYARAQPAESDPSLNEYIQKLENLHHRLEQNPHRYQK